MNLSLDQFIGGLERTACGLRELLTVWDEIDEDLCQEYVDQLSWLLRVRPDVLTRATQEGRFLEIAQRMNDAVLLIWDIRADVEQKMTGGLGMARVRANGHTQDAARDHATEDNASAGLA